MQTQQNLFNFDDQETYVSSFFAFWPRAGPTNFHQIVESFSSISAQDKWKNNNLVRKHTLNWVLLEKIFIIWDMVIFLYTIWDLLPTGKN